MFNKLKQFREMRSQAKQIQDSLKQESVTIEKGAVKIVMDGNQEVISCALDSSKLSPEKKSELEKDVKEAINTANDKVRRIMASKMQSMGGLDAFKGK